MKYALLLGLAILASATHAAADGKMFWREEVPPTIPYQRALIVHHEGRETLVVQSKYEVPDDSGAASLGWVVPVPSVPEVASMPADLAQSMFNDLDFRSHPKVTRVSRSVGTVAFLLTSGFTALTFILLLVSLGIPKRYRSALLGNRSRLLRAFGISFAAWIVVIALSPAIMNARKGGGGGVEILKAQQVGIYDVKVVRSGSTDDLVAWLQEHGFRYGDEDRASFAAHVDKNWCFVVAIIRPENVQDQNEVVAEGMAAPLILNFPTRTPVYPLALTATGQHDTQVLIYFAGEVRMDCGGRLTLRYAGKNKGHPEMMLYYSTLDAKGKAPGFLETEDFCLPYLCKFRDTLTPAQMNEDLIFTPAADNEPYRETLVRW